MAFEIVSFRICTSVTTREQIITKIAQIDALLDLLYASAATGATSGDIAEYEIDTGQSKQRVTHTNLTTVSNAISVYELQRNKLEARLAPKQVRLMDRRNFGRKC